MSRCLSPPSQNKDQKVNIKRNRFSRDKSFFQSKKMRFRLSKQTAKQIFTSSRLTNKQQANRALLITTTVSKLLAKAKRKQGGSSSSSSIQILRNINKWLKKMAERMIKEILYKNHLILRKKKTSKQNLITSIKQLCLDRMMRSWMLQST